MKRSELAENHETNVHFSERDLKDRYRQDLDDCNSVVKIGSLGYNPSCVLEHVDPIAFRCGFTDWLDSENYQECNECTDYIQL